MEALVDDSRRRWRRCDLGERRGLVAKAGKTMRSLAQLRRTVNPDRLETFAVVVVVALSLWLLVSCVVKAQDHGSFVSTVESHGLFAADWVRGLGIAFIVIEGVAATAALGLSISSRRTTSFAALLVAGFFMLLAVYAAILVAFPPATPVSCGCGVGDEQAANWKRITIQNAGVALLAVICGVWLSWRQATVLPSQLAEDSSRSSAHVAH
jgi:hypothetical protein